MATKDGGDRPGSFQHEWEAINYLKNNRRHKKKKDHFIKVTEEKGGSLDAAEEVGSSSSPGSASTVAPTVTRRLTREVLDAQASAAESWASSRSPRDANNVVAQKFFADDDDLDEHPTSGSHSRTASRSDGESKHKDRERSRRVRKSSSRRSSGADVEHPRSRRSSRGDLERSKSRKTSGTAAQVERLAERSSTTEAGGTAAAPSTSAVKRPKARRRKERKEMDDTDELDADATGIPLRTLTVAQLCHWLGKHDLGCYNATIEEGVVTGEMLAYVSAKELKWLGVGTPEEQQRILRIVKHARRRGVEIHGDTTTMLPSL